MSRPRLPILETHVSAPEGDLRWRDSFALFAGAVLEIAKALHRIADAMERDRS